MFRFQHVEYFWFLLLIPVIILVYLYFLGWRRRNLKKLGESSFVKELISGKINGRLTTKVALVSLSSVCLIAALANLQAGGHAEKTERKGLDVVFALDVSNSMLAEDVSPNRLTKAKELIYRTLEQMHNDRTGLVVFAGNAYLQVPLTVDYGAMKMLLASVTPGMIPTQGTNFSQAIQMAGNSFSQKEKKNKVLVLISDGEDHDETAIDAAKAAAEKGVIIYTIGIGSPRGSTITDPTTGQPKVDEQGNVVVTKLNEAELKSIADATGGRYQLLQNAGRVSENLVNAIAQLGTKNLGAVVYTDYDSYFQYFLGGGLILFLIAFLLPDAKKIKRPGGTKVQPKAVASGTTLFWIGLLSVVVLLLSPRQLWAQQQKEQQPDLALKKAVSTGNDFYHKKQYDSAGVQYMKALKKQPNSFEGNFNMGDALYQSGRYDHARTAMTNSLKSAKTKEDQAAAYHNIGNTFLKQKQWQQAADAFKKSLLLQPKDRDTKYNLAYAQEMLKQQQQKKNNKNGKDKKNNKNDKDKQDKQQPKDSKDKQNQDKQQQQNEDKKKDEQQQKQQQNQQQKDGDEDKKEQQAQSRPSKLSKKQADNILNALNQEEQALHKRKKEQTGVPVQPGKDW